MKLIQKLTSVVTGQNRKTQSIEGRNVDFFYQGKFIAVNPFSLVRDINFKLQAELKETNFQYFLSPSLTFENILQNEPVIKHTLFAQVKLECGLFKVCRSVESGSKYPISRYDMILEGDSIATMIRKYDYGNEFAEIHQKLSSTLGQAGLSFENRVSWKSKGSEMLCLEKFGHTHLYRFLDLNRFQDLVGEVAV